MKLKITTAVFLFVLILPIASVAQSASDLGLVLTGTRRSLSDGGVVDRGDDLAMRYGFLMTFENKGREPVILINPTLSFGTGLKQARLVFRSTSRGRTTLENPISIKTFELNSSHAENFKSMAQYFEGPKPPENMTIIVNPGESFSFEEEFFVELSLVKGNLDEHAQEISAGLKEDENGRYWALQHFKRWGFPIQNFQLTYEFSFLSHVSDPDLLEKMSYRWRRYGRLPIGINGTYTITSEPIK